MKFCTHCGKQLMDEAVICTGCGCSVETKSTTVGQTTSSEQDKANVGLLILSILLPLVGIILWPVKHKETPKAAMTYGIVAICAWVGWILLSPIIFDAWF